jgi:hypothetical protein
MWQLPTAAQRGSTNNHASGGSDEPHPAPRSLLSSGHSSHPACRPRGVPAAARPDAGGQLQPRFSYENCELNRVGTQLVKCDNLTGGGVQAPVWVPEY